MIEIFANSGDPDQTPHNAASDLGLHCLPMTRLGVSSLQWIRVDLSIEAGWGDPFWEEQPPLKAFKFHLKKQKMLYL